MSKSGIFHKGFQLFLTWMHANRLGQIPVAVGVASHQLAQPGSGFRSESLLLWVYHQIEKANGQVWVMEIECIA